MSEFNNSEKRFLEFEIRKNWIVLIEIEKAENGMINFWLRHKSHGIISLLIDTFKQGLIKFLKERSLEVRELKPNDLNYMNKESVIKFSNIFLDGIIDEGIEIYADDYFIQNDKNYYFGEDY